MFNNKVVVVTGGASGIGRAVCIEFARNGANIAIIDRKRHEAENTAGEVKKIGQKAVVVCADVSVPKEVKAAFLQVMDDFGHIDVLVNSTEIVMESSIDELTMEQLDQTLDINLHGTFVCTQEAGRIMKEQGGGSIINISSDAAFRGRENQIAFCASKGALTAFTQSAAYQLGEYGIRVNALVPGLIDTQLESFVDDPVKREKRISHTPLRRIGKAEDVAKASVFFASDNADFITGTLLTVDGGASIYITGVDF